MVLAFDTYIVINTFILAYLIRFNFELNFDIGVLFPSILLVTLVSLVVFLMVGSYKNIIRYTGYKDAFRVSVASFFYFRYPSRCSTSEPFVECIG
jgi:FlaA1/EpsC-like NDP-sugar epimerase